MGEQLQGGCIDKAHGVVVELVDEERIDGCNELGFEGALNGEIKCIFGLVSLELVIGCRDLVAGGIVKLCRGRARFARGREDDSGED